MLITEFRIPMPNTNEEYRIGQLYSVAVMSKEETSNGEGIEVLKNEPFENEMGKGQYTYKIYHIGKKVPEWAQKLIPAKMLDFHEEAWNAFPYCKTVVTCPFMGEKYLMRITSMHKEDNGQTENIHNLDAEQLKKRKVKYLDIVNDKVDKYKKEDDPKLYKPTKVNRAQLGADWTKSSTPIMTCYKLVEVKAAIFGIQSKIEAKILEIQAQIFLNLHRKLYCRTDEWITLTIEDIRQIEDKIQAELAESFKKKAAPVKGAPAKPGSVQKATPGSIAKPTPGAVTKAATPSSATPSPSTATPTAATSTGSGEELAVSEEALKEIEQALEKETIQE